MQRRASSLYDGLQVVFGFGCSLIVAVARLSCDAIELTEHSVSKNDTRAHGSMHDFSGHFLRVFLAKKRVMKKRCVILQEKRSQLVKKLGDGLQHVALLQVSTTFL